MTERESAVEQPESARTSQGFSLLLNGHIGLTGPGNGYLELRAINFQIPAEWPQSLFAALHEYMLARAAEALSND